MELRSPPRGYGSSEIDRGDAERGRNKHGRSCDRGHRPASRPGSRSGEDGSSAEAQGDSRKRLDRLKGEAERQRGAEADARPVQGERGRTRTGPEVPGVRGSRPASAIAASRTTATQMGCGTPSAIAIATAPATRATHEQPIQPKRAAPSRGERAMERKIWSRLPIRPAVLALRRVPTPSTTTTPRASKGAGQSGTLPTTAAGTISAARTSVRAAATEAATPPARQSRSSPGKRAREQSEPDRSAEMRGRERIDERADRVAGGDLREAGAAAASSQAHAPAGRRGKEANGEEGRCGDDPARLSTGQVGDGAAERPPPDPGHADRDARGQEEAGTDRVVAPHRPELTQRELVEETRSCVLADHVTHAIGTK